MNILKRLFGKGNNMSTTRPPWIDKLEDTIDAGEQAKQVKGKILAMGNAASEPLAQYVLDFNLDNWIRDPDTGGETGRAYRAAQSAMWLIGEIGAPLDTNTVAKLLDKFVNRGLKGCAIKENWGGLWSDITQSLEKLGQIR